jgi:hypothetical protein
LSFVSLWRRDSNEKAEKRLTKRNSIESEQLDSNISRSSENNQPSKRTLQNRKAQREFRDRKASYVKSLEQRIRAYESNEIQGNVELQRVARRLKEENDQLREQVKQLSERLAILEGGDSEMAASPPSRTPGRSRGSSIHQRQKSQPPPPTLYNQPQGFSGDFTAYEMISSSPPFQTSSNTQGYPQYFAQVRILGLIISTNTFGSITTPTFNINQLFMDKSNQATSR